MVKPLKVSVNILTWNTIDTLKDTLDVLEYDLAHIENEIIIVDNGSNDGCEKLATIANKENKGVSIGKNQAINASEGEYIFWLDGDIVPVQNSINCLIEWLDKNKDEYAIGFYPNKFTTDKRTAEKYCASLYDPQVYTGSNAYYGLFRRTMFTDKGIMFDESGPFGKEGYGWEERDLFMQMKRARINQWVAGLNTLIGKYYHAINSSIPLMGHETYISTSKERHEYYKRKWAC